MLARPEIFSEAIGTYGPTIRATRSCGKLDYLRLKKGWGVEELYEMFADEKFHTPLDKRTVKSTLEGKSVFLKSAKVVAIHLGAEDLVSVLHPDLLDEIGPPSGWWSPLEFFSKVGEWDILEPLAGAEQTSNGLQYDTWKARHRHVPNRFGRAKCYDLSQLADRDRTRLRRISLATAKSAIGSGRIPTSRAITTLFPGSTTLGGG